MLRLGLASFCALLFASCQAPGTAPPAQGDAPLAQAETPVVQSSPAGPRYALAPSATEQLAPYSQQWAQRLGSCHGRQAALPAAWGVRGKGRLGPGSQDAIKIHLARPAAAPAPPTGEK